MASNPKTESKAVTEDPKVDLFEDDDEFEEFESEEWDDDKEGEKESLQQWEDDWDDDDVNDDFSVQLKVELESNSHKNNQEIYTKAAKYTTNETLEETEFAGKKFIGENQIRR